VLKTYPIELATSPHDLSYGITHKTSNRDVTLPIAFGIGVVTP
jgi:hypothetical protein